MGRLLSTLLVTLAIGCSTTASSEPTATATATPSAGTFTKAAYEQHIQKLRARLRKHRLGAMVVRIEDPFVVIGDGTAAELARDAGTVRWAADKLEQDFFVKRPRKILDVFLFSDASSYEDGVRALTGESPTTPYGFYSSSEGGLFMNIATGGGTLVHELVHPYVEADFAGAPPWLNEGLGSLFEQSAEVDGHIVGRTNWRLSGLQKAITAGRLQSFEKLLSLDAAAFYGDDSGVNYAQARYLLYYLQDKGVLREFYKAFRAARATDRTGFATLVTTLGETDMIAFQARWEAHVATLRFP
jgi:hypothetical protein